MPRLRRRSVCTSWRRGFQPEGGEGGTGEDHYPPAEGVRVFSYPLDDLGIEIRVHGKLKPAQRELVTDWFQLVQKALSTDVREGNDPKE